MISEKIYDYRETDVAVIGAGHAGIEAALCCARLGLETVLFTINLDSVGNMPCNPAIGGTGKGHLVFEIDALGGEMGYAADKVTIQSRTLNLGKGPAVHSKRVQADRRLYQEIMKHTLEEQKNLMLVQAEISDILTENGNVSAVVTALGAKWKTKAAIICSGTYLNAQVLIGDTVIESGPDGMLPAKHLSSSLERLGIKTRRFKTGTPPRVYKGSIDFSKLEVQDGEEYIRPFSALTDEKELNSITQIPCHIAYTNEKTHEIIRENLDRSPIYSGKVHVTGPRYCPSIEDKVVRFAEKERHQLFVEPMGKMTDEMYLQGFSSSMPEEVQMKMLHSISGFENAQVMRTAYAIQYDCIDPTDLYPTLEFKKIGGLYGAGQFNGTSGYEEAAAQGLVAGINAAMKILGKEPLVLTRDTSYIGMLIDDLVTKGTNEPYRVMTSRSEYRLLLRQDNADRRLTPFGRAVGLINDERYARFTEKQKRIDEEIERLNNTHIGPSDKLNTMLREKGSTEITNGFTLADILKRPEISYEDLKGIYDFPELTRGEEETVEVSVKYEGYIMHQIQTVEKFKKLESRSLSHDIDYEMIKGLRLEARQKLNEIKPENIGQASRISGVSPADISVLLIWLEENNAR